MGFLLLQLGYNLTYELHPVVTLQIQRLSQPNMVCNHQSVGFPQLELQQQDWWMSLLWVLSDWNLSIARG